MGAVKKLCRISAELRRDSNRGRELGGLAFGLQLSARVSKKTRILLKACSALSETAQSAAKTAKGFAQVVGGGINSRGREWGVSYLERPHDLLAPFGSLKAYRLRGEAAYPVSPEGVNWDSENTLD